MAEVQMTVNLKWYHFRQNNSGGHFDVDENVAEDVFIQARNAEEARNVGERFFYLGSGSCSCCGPRWSPEYVEDGDGNDQPLKYGEVYAKADGDWFSKEVRYHWFDGRVTNTWE